jgi:hypothetical protein
MATKTKTRKAPAAKLVTPKAAGELVPLHKDYDSFVGCVLVLAGSG